MGLILVRHAATDGNGQRFVGREDLTLNAEGRRQAAALARHLADARIDHVLSSPLSRAVETARALAGPRGLTIELRPGLVELDFGDLQGLRKDEQRPALRKAHLTTPLPGGESLADVWRRLGPVAAEVSRTVRAGLTVAVVGHYWSNRLFLGAVRGQSLEEAARDRSYRPENASAFLLDAEALAGAARTQA